MLVGDYVQPSSNVAARGKVEVGALRDTKPLLGVLLTDELLSSAKLSITFSLNHMTVLPSHY
jgi:hypothetical protein